MPPSSPAIATLTFDRISTRTSPTACQDCSGRGQPSLLARGWKRVTQLLSNIGTPHLLTGLRPIRSRRPLGHTQHKVRLERWVTGTQSYWDAVQLGRERTNSDTVRRLGTRARPQTTQEHSAGRGTRGLLVPPRSIAAERRQPLAETRTLHQVRLPQQRLERTRKHSSRRRTRDDKLGTQLGTETRTRAASRKVIGYNANTCFGGGYAN